MKKPYVKKYTKIVGFTVWIVDGKYIRDNIDEEFTNYGQHYRFKFIPKKEFWIDKEHGYGREEKYFVDHLLAEYKFMSNGMNYDSAIEKADLIEKRERSKDILFRQIKEKKETKKKIINQVHKKLLKRYSKKIRVWVINGMLVRNIFFIDFTEGGHDKVYDFIPQNEIWLDDDTGLKERKFILLHEIHERNLMAKGKDYETAHKSSSEIEYFCRHHPNKIDRKLKEEFKKVVVNI